MKRLTAILVFSATCALVYACGHDDGTENVGPEGVIYEGTATDEALVVLLAATPKAGATVTITAPTSDQMVPAAAPMTFTWTGGLSAAASPAPDVEVGRDLGLGQPKPLLQRVLASLVGTFQVRPALAHPMPHNGQGYYLRVISNNKEIVKVFTSARSYTPDAATWQRLTAAGGELRATLLSAFFEKNSITSDGGPVEAAPVNFRIAP
jgi:hypothetical protein